MQLDEMSCSVIESVQRDYYRLLCGYSNFFTNKEFCNPTPHRGTLMFEDIAQNGRRMFISVAVRRKEVQSCMH